MRIPLKQPEEGRNPIHCPKCGEIEPVLHCEHCGHNFVEDNHENPDSDND